MSDKDKSRRRPLITLGGFVGAGKSTTGRIVAERLGLRHYSNGDFVRDMAKERGIDFADFDNIIRTTTAESIQINREIDARPATIARGDEGAVIDGHIAFHFVPESFKVYLDIDPEIAAQRIFDQKREDEPYKNLQEVLAFVINRGMTMQRRFRDLYGVDIRNLSHYDLVINTGLQENDIEHVVQQVINGYQEWLDN